MRPITKGTDMGILDLINFTWLRNLLGIRKDKVEMKKAELEIEKLNHEYVKRNLVTQVSVDDIMKYDVGRLELERKALEEKRYSIVSSIHFMFPFEQVAALDARIIDICIEIATKKGLEEEVARYLSIKRDLELKEEERLKELRRRRGHLT